MAQLNTDLETIKTARDNMKTALEGKGQTVTKDIRTYAEAITNIEGGGSGDVKLFETVELMQADSTAQEGDLAVVYREEMQPVTEESEFDSCIFPNEVVLDEAFTGNVSERFRQVDDGYFDGIINVSSTAVIFQGYGESSEIRVEYTSQNGITYTRTDGGEELQEFGTTIKWYNMGGPFHSIIGNFMKIGGNHFEGLYEYKAFKNKNKIHIYSYSELAWDNSTSKLTGTGGEVIEFDIEATLNKITEYTETNFSDYRSGTYYNNPIYEYMLYYDNNCIVFPFTTQNEGTPYKFINNLSLLIDNTTWKATGGIIMTSPSVTYNLHEIRVNLTTGQLSYELLEENFTNETYQPLTRFNNYKFVGNINSDGVFNYEYQNGLTTILYYSTDDSTWYESNCIYGEKPGIDDIKYLFADTQLDATSDYVYEKTFYGKNGIETGTLTTNVSNSFADVNAEVYAKIQEQYDNMQPRVLTDQDKTIDTNIKIIPVKSDGTPLLDTSNVTNMSYMFTNHKSLVCIPLIDTSSVTNMYNMFSDCSALTTVPLLNTQNVTKMDAMFTNCSALTTVPLLNTQNVIDMYNMFLGCSSLTTVPLFNTQKVTDMRFMFSECSSLSNESLNNILAMCTNATKISTSSNKTLKKIGLTQAQAQICTTLSNYSTFTNAGWTTGY